MRGAVIHTSVSKGFLRACTLRSVAYSSTFRIYKLNGQIGAVRPYVKIMNKNILDGFPYSKEEFKELCATVDILTMEVLKKASSKFSTIQVLQILKGYQSLKYPLMAIWEYYGFGNVEEITFPTTSLLYYQAFKVDTIDSLNQLIKGFTVENPFNFYGTIPNSEKVLDKMLISYRHLLNNLISGNLHF